MGKRTALFFVLLLVGCAGVATKPQTPDPDTQIVLEAGALDAAARSDLQKKIEELRVANGIPGIAYAVIRHGEVSFYGVAGYRAASKEAPVALDDPFELSSNSKAMLATIAGLMVQEGRLTWDSNLYDAFRATVPGLSPGWERITLHRLLTQTTGLSDPLWTMLHLAREKFPSPKDGRIAFVRHTLASAPPAGRQKFNYQNVNYLLAAAMIEQASGASIEDLERERIFTPLGMASAGFGAPGHPGTLDAPEGHGGRTLFSYPLPWLLGERAFDPGEEHADVPRWLDPVGLVHAGIRDWARFIGFELNSHPVNPNRVPGLLAPETEIALTTPDPADQTYNGGWYLIGRTWARGARLGDRGVVLSHQGDNARWSSVAYVAPEIEFAILLVCNRTGRAKGLDEIAGYLVAHFAGR